MNDCKHLTIANDKHDYNDDGEDFILTKLIISGRTFSKLCVFL